MAVSRKETYRITVLPGDGIGPEITSATAEVLSSLCKRCGFEMDLKEALIGGAAIDAKNDPFPDETLQQCLASDSVLLACIGGYKVRLSVCVCLQVQFQLQQDTCVVKEQRTPSFSLFQILYPSLYAFSLVGQQSTTFETGVWPTQNEEGARIICKP
jgi:hypothetical protein